MPGMSQDTLRGACRGTGWRRHARAPPPGSRTICVAALDPCPPDQTGQARELTGGRLMLEK